MSAWWPVALLLATSATGSDLNAGLQAALASRARGNPKEAEVSLQRLTEQSPGWALPWIELSELHLSLAEWDLARSAISQAAVLDPANPRVYHDRALVEQAQGQTDLAERDEVFAVGLRPEYSEAQANLAELLWGDGKRQESVALLESLSTTYPAYLPFTVRLVDAYLDLGQNAAAEHSLRLLILREPGSPIWHRRLSRLLAAQGLAVEATREGALADSMANQANKPRSMRRLPKSKH